MVTLFKRPGAEEGLEVIRSIEDVETVGVADDPARLEAHQSRDAGEMSALYFGELTGARYPDGDLVGRRKAPADCAGAREVYSVCGITDVSH